MLYISDIFNVDTKEHYDRIKSFTQAQMMYCVELRDFTTGEQRAMCMPKVVVAEEIIPFGVVNPNRLQVLERSFIDLLSYINIEMIDCDKPIQGNLILAKDYNLKNTDLL